MALSTADIASIIFDIYARWRRALNTPRPLYPKEINPAYIQQEIGSDPETVGDLRQSKEILRPGDRAA